MVVVPVVGMVPLQPPDAAQLLALVAFHCSVTGVPMATVLSFAFKTTNGGAAVAGAVALLAVALLRCSGSGRWQTGARCFRV